ncbi:MAG TPA: long-chain fatty acid--CoA ligase [Marinilabiliales bacterium]|jgi:long-chain acyl-CoA synthetase|nr:MAG: long-chain fatty acid--CoA ligase [Bacteroidetes bacterium GWA2_40_14]OFX62741.1 MAG: long-chain fatty acid--CoA ligase [Bacteroidetes bacterium GWC2_40_13]OFX71987.1 MAG: long-chain fatty acid--CoA ligase [Bacteroidetes bacterium GWD2_40_43]OFX89593.1 MAG: long-chain fatty acid--CoA ligase [Bacteroidetes bacterium GWE2_40_63]OFY24112.1 MAG: long-chain fatty acid--CoA ligase [Bacteroidetes bacterium GWF2_40_13]OFZ26303.1 MAG: long-chain fatty acid--CoA ligase [Bacteroidetes bacterium R
MKTIIQLFEENVSKYPKNPLLKEKKKDQYQNTSYSEAHGHVQHYAAGLLSMGIKKGDRLALLSEGRNDWVYGELAVLYIGAINVPLSIKLEPIEIKFRLEHSGTRMIIVSKSQAAKVEAIVNELPELEKVIYLDEKTNYGTKEIAWAQVYQMGVKFNQEFPHALTETKNQIKGDDFANISYTSGTTADPKGIILSHRNYTANVEQALSLMNIPDTYKTLLILPLDHCFAHVAGIYSFIACGASMAFVQMGETPLMTLKNIPINIKEVKPDLLLSVPALAKNFKKNIEKGIAEKGKFTEKLFNYALNVAYKYNKEGDNKGRGLNALRWPLVKLFDIILFSKVRQVFGGDLKFFIGGGALLDIELQRFYYAIGIPMMQGYGLSEATPVISSNSLFKHRLGTSGYLVKPLDLKICDDDGNELPLGEKGEIVVSGENVMKGYWRNEKSSAEAIKNGWLHTGDLGYMDKDGFLYVLGRFKSLLISNDGEKYSPESIEEMLVSKSPFIEQLMLHNNQNPYTIGLVVPNSDALKRHISEKGLDIGTPEGKKEALKLLQQEINHYKKGGKFEGEFPERWLPAAVGILEEPFTEQNKFINSTLKMVRGKITEHYKERIDFLYTSEAKNIVNEVNMNALSKNYKN